MEFLYRLNVATSLARCLALVAAGALNIFRRDPGSTNRAGRPSTGGIPATARASGRATGSNAITAPSASRPPIS